MTADPGALSRLLIVDECTTLINRYTHYADLGRRSHMPDLFTDDGVLAFPDERIEGIVALRAHFRRDNPPRTTRHMCSNTVIDIDDPDHAHGTTFLAVYAHEGAVDGPAPIGPPVRVGHYDDVFIRTSAGWRFSLRTVTFAFGRRVVDEQLRSALFGDEPRSP